MNKYKFSKKHLLTFIAVLLFIAPVFYTDPQAAILFGGFFVVVGGIIFLALKVVRALLAPMIKMHNDFLKANGFSPCTEEEKQKLQEAVSRFKAGLQGFTLDDAVKAQMNGKTVFQYYYNDPHQIGSSQRNTRSVRQFEMIVPFPRHSSETVIVALKRKDGMGKLLQNAVTKWVPTAAKLFSSKDNPLEVLKLPPELENGNIRWIIGPPQRTVHDLLAPKKLEAILHGTEVGVETVVVGNNTALVGFANGYVTADGYAKLPTYLAELASRE